MSGSSPELASDLAEWGRRVTAYFERTGRPHSLEAWTDDVGGPPGAVGLRLSAHTPEPDLSLVYWLRPDDDSWWLAVDDGDAAEPTRFARRTARIFAGETALRRLEHLVIAQVSAVGRDL